MTVGPGELQGLDDPVLLREVAEQQDVAAAAGAGELAAECAIAEGELVQLVDRARWR